MRIAIVGILVFIVQLLLGMPLNACENCAGEGPEQAGSKAAEPICQCPLYEYMTHNDEVRYWYCERCGDDYVTRSYAWEPEPAATECISGQCPGPIAGRPRCEMVPAYCTTSGDPEARAKKGKLHAPKRRKDEDNPVVDTDGANLVGSFFVEFDTGGANEGRVHAKVMIVHIKKRNKVKIPAIVMHGYEVDEGKNDDIPVERTCQYTSEGESVYIVKIGEALVPIVTDGE